MSMNIRFEPAAVHEGHLRVTSLRGEEAIGRPYRFEIEICASDPELPLDAILGQAAVLTLGERRVHGIVAEISQGDATEGGYLYHAVLSPRAWLASLGTRSRMFQGLSAPDIALAVLGGIGVRAEARLSRSYPAEGHVVQYKESGLDFMTRLLSAEGIAYHFEQAEGGERLILTDDNAGFRDRVEGLFGTRDDTRGSDRRTSRGETSVSVESFTCRRRVMPRAVLLHDDGASPDLPVEAQAEVDERGFGLHTEHGGGLGTPERAAAMAARAAEALRAEGTRFSGTSRQPVSAGGILAVRGHFRRDFDADYLVTAARHEARGGDYRVAFEAIRADTPYRPRPARKPKIDGFVQARVEAPAGQEGAADSAGRYRVRLPFDLGGASEGAGSPPVPQISPDGATRFAVQKGTPVMVGFLDGDPDRPVIAGGLPAGGARAGVSAAGGPRGVIFETSSPGAARPKGRRVDVDGALPRERQLADDGLEYAEESTASEWIRFAVPLGADNTKCSYVRYGEPASSSPSSLSFNEKTKLEGEFTSKYFDDDGKGAGEGAGFSWSLSSLGDPFNPFAELGIDFQDGPKVYTTQDDVAASAGGAAWFDWENSAGVYDYTDENRTVITQGNYQNVTAGNRTDVILGDYRVVIPKRTQGVYDADDYFMRFYKDALNSWRKIEVGHVKSLAFNYGDQESGYVGFKADVTLGTTVAAGLGFNVGVTSGFNLNVGAGFSYTYDLGNSWSKTKGKKFSSSQTETIEATDKITLRIPETDPFTNMSTYSAMVGVTTAACVTLTLGAATEFVYASLAGRSAAVAVAAALFGTAMALSRKLQDASASEEEPSIEITKEHICLSIGNSSITLEKDSIVIETGDKDPMITLKAGESINLKSGDQQVDLDAANNSVGIFAKEGVAVLTPELWCDQAFTCDGAAKIAGQVFQVNE